MISVHFEAEPHLQRALQMIRDGGAKAGIAINPATPAESLSTAIEFCDFVLVMTVNPGFGGQKFIEPVVPKIRHISQMIRERGLPVEIEVDGGIDATDGAGGRRCRRDASSSPDRRSSDSATGRLQWRRSGALLARSA